jgi:thimet oligopeptidase
MYMQIASSILSLLLSGVLPDPASVAEMYPKNAAAADMLVSQVLEDATRMKADMLAIPAQERTYENTVMASDRLDQLLSLVGSILGVFEAVSPDVEHRNDAMNTFRAASTVLMRDKAFFTAFSDYEQHGMKTEELAVDQRYYFEEQMKAFRVQGYAFDDEKFARVTALSKEIRDLGSRFSAAINADCSSVVIDQDALVGVDPVFLAAQERTIDRKIVIRANTPSVNAVMKYCSNPQTRKALLSAWNTRAYPENIATLEALIAARDRYAKLLGFESYNALTLSTALIKTPENAYAFLNSLEPAARAVCRQDFAEATKTFPPDVVPDAEGKIHAFDVAYAFEAHEKAKYSLDNRLVSQYFPVNKTIAGIFAIYQKFMNIEFEHHASVDGAWHESVQAITVYTKGRTQLLGHILLDLYPRPNKYSHACCCSGVSRVFSRPDLPSTAVLITNFPAPNGDEPALLMHDDVVTFFHEFGHAIHTTLSFTRHGGTCAFAVPTDFVELPSQILELWMWDREMLKMVSSHVVTGEPLPDAIIDQMLAARTFGRGRHELRQLFLAMVSLEYFKAGENKNTIALLQECSSKYSEGVILDTASGMQASFGHLYGYGPAYYGYALSRSYAHDVFAIIKKQGLLDPKVGEGFVTTVLVPGASKDAGELLVDFLGRPATSDAYIKWLKE